MRRQQGGVADRHLTFSFRAPLLLLPYLTPPLAQVLLVPLLLRPLLALLQSSQMMAPSLRPSTQRCLPSSTRARLSPKVGWLQSLQVDENIMWNDVLEPESSDALDMATILCWQDKMLSYFWIFTTDHNGIKNTESIVRNYQHFRLSAEKIFAFLQAYR